MPDCPVDTPCLRRGAAFPVVLEDPDGTCAAATMLLSSPGKVPAGAETATATAFELSADGARPFLSSERFFDEGWAAFMASAVTLASSQQQWELQAQVVSEGCAPAALPTQFVLGPDRQAIVVSFTPGFDVAVDQFGLGAHHAAIEQAVLAKVAAHFSGYAVRVDSRPHPAYIEYTKIAVLDRDPNGMGLLGTDNTPGKDVGNKHLDEHIRGINRTSRNAGRAAYGGVFVGELFVYSRKLNPASKVSDHGFDAIFGPWSPKLGGTPATDTDEASQAVDALAELVAGTVSHEIGHALGLAAGTDLFHHDGDHPRWRMDAGVHRPFGERAGIDGKEVWGPVDAAYLAKILPVE